MSSQKISLPVDQYISQIIETLNSQSSIVVTAAPGAGKTTRVPPGLVNLSKKKILVLEPRRIAALAAADRIASENHWKLGQQVGYEVRFDRKLESLTKIVFITEALLLKKLVSDPQLSEFDIVILDEFHERSIYTDLAIGFIKELQLLERPDLKLIVMSATLDAQKISEFLDQASVLSVPGQLFSIEIIYDQKPQSLVWNPDLLQRVFDKIKQAIQVCEKDILVFLPGVFEIEQCLRKSQEIDILDSFLCLPLHGRLTLDQQKLALEKNRSRKIIFSTNLAESSVTVDGLDCVIDTGLERSSVYQYASGFEKLSTHRTSQASAKQRAGRSARQKNGFCFKMWMNHDERSFSEFSLPEIKTQNLSETLLFLIKMGISEPSQFSWFEKPPRSNIQQSLKRLNQLKLIHQDNLTILGDRVQKQPLSIRFSLLLENFKAHGQEQLGAWVAAYLSEKVSMPVGHDDYECDITSLLMSLHQPGRDRVQKVAQQLCPSAQRYRYQIEDDQLLKKILVLSFADQLGKRRSENSDRGLLANGRGVQIHPNCRVKKSPYFVALEAFDTDSSQESKVAKACGLSEDFLFQNFQEEIQTTKKMIWNEDKKEFQMHTEKNLWGLKIGKSTVEKPDQNYIKEHLPEIAFQNFEWILKNHEELYKWWIRFHFYKKFVEKMEWVEIEKENVIREVMNQACLTSRSLNDLLNQNLIYHFESQFPSEVIKKFHQVLPPTIQAGRGKVLPIHYEGDHAPFIEVRIQDAFIWNETPVVGDKIPLTLYLLAPNMRPAQVTNDLAGFWSGSYADVRKELKARYPKHDWPEPRAKKS